MAPEEVNWRMRRTVEMASPRGPRACTTKVITERKVKATSTVKKYAAA